MTDNTNGHTATTPAAAASPVSFLDALKGRYGAEDDITSYDPSAFLVGDVGRKKNKTWELVGMEKTRVKQSRYHRLVDVVLRDAGITIAVKPSEINGNSCGGGGFKDELAAQRMVSLTELDLSANENLSLTEIAKLIPYFPRMETLQLSDMPGLLPSFSDIISSTNINNSINNSSSGCGGGGGGGGGGDATATTTNASSSSSPGSGASVQLSSEKLRKLVLNNVGVTSMVQLRLLLDLPNLDELHLDSNSGGLTNLVLCANAAEEAFLASRPGGVAWLQIPSVATLSLARNNIASWESLGETLPKVFPSLTKLFLADNQLPNLLLPGTVVAAVTAKCEAELIAQKEERAKAVSTNNNAGVVGASFPYFIESINDDHTTTTTTTTTYTFLKPLTLLCLNDNTSITDTRTVDTIRILCPVLDVFRITYSGLLPRWNDTLSRMYVVASVPTMKLLNRGQVRPKERLDSEIFYIQRGMAQREQVEKLTAIVTNSNEDEKKKNDRGDGDDDGYGAITAYQASKMLSAIARDEPQYLLLDLLREKHRDLVLSIYRAGATASSDGSSHLMLNVRLRCENNRCRANDDYDEAVDADMMKKNGKTTQRSAWETTKTTAAAAAALDEEPLNMFNEVTKVLPSTLTVARLKALFKVAFQIDLPNQRISYRSGDDGVLETPVVLDNELQTLGYYGVSNGAVITVRDTSLR